MENGHLRVGTAQREHAIEILRNAAADDRITFDELETRVPQVLKATTRQDLAEVLGDLVAAADLVAALPAESSLGDGPGYAWDNPMIFRSVDRKGVYCTGEWEVPPFIEVQLTKGKAVLDFSRAVTRASVIDIELVGRRTTFLIVPDGWAVDGGHIPLTSLTGFTSLGIRSRPRKGCPLVVVRGGGVTVARLTAPSDIVKSDKHLAKGRPALPSRAD